MKAACSDQEFIALWEQHGSATKLAKILGVNVRNVISRRNNLEIKLDRPLISTGANSPLLRTLSKAHKAKEELSIKNGTVLVGSDAHYRPDDLTTAHRAFVSFAKELKPCHIVMNGDAFDGARIGRHPKIGFLESSPSVKDELNCVIERLNEIRKAAKGAGLHWTLGNHDLRYEARLAAAAPEYEGVQGMHLKDHFPFWHPSWAIFINGNTVIKHRYHNGIHAVYNNILKSGMSMVTGHLHSLKVTPWSDYNGTRYGVDTGTMAEPYDEQFAHYTELNPVNWRSGFAVLTFRGGQLMPPELVEVLDEGKVFFRGEIHHV